jgi:LysM repeat protein
VPALLAGAAVAVVVVILNAPGSSGTHAKTGASAHAGVHHLRPFWKVRTGDTLAQIAVHTGLTINRLEALNPNVDPNALQPGERLNLWSHPPAPHKPGRKPLGPKYWIVAPGQSFGSIAADTGIDIFTLEQLNPRLRSTTLQPGERVKLRHGAPLGELLSGHRGAALAAAWRDLGGRPASRHATGRHAGGQQSALLF